MAKRVTAAASPEDKGNEKKEAVSISPPRFTVREFTIVGKSPYVQARFSGKAMQAMKAKMIEGQAAKKGAKREPRDFDADFKNAMHVSEDGWIGVPAAAFRNACIDVCRMVGFKMTHAKMSIFIEADGLDKIDGMQLVKLIAGQPERMEMAVRNQTGVADIRVRPLWREWKLKLRIRFDLDQFSVSDVANLLTRAGMQVGIGEGRAFSKESNGLGYGFFEIANQQEVKNAA
jgi:hypothetical protein